MTDTTTRELRDIRDVADQSLTAAELALIRAATPDEHWVKVGSTVNIPYSADDDDPSETGWDHGRYIGVEDNDWHGIDALPDSYLRFIAASPTVIRRLLDHIALLQVDLNTVVTQQDTLLREQQPRGAA